MKAIGMNTTTIEKVVAATARRDLGGPLVRRGPVILALLDVADDVLADDDGVVDQDADGQRQAEQRHRVQGEAEGPHRDERGQHRDRQRQAGDDRRAPRVQEHEDDEDGQQRRLRPARSARRPPSWSTRGPVSRATTNSTPGGSDALIAVHLLADPGADVGGAGAVGLDDVDADRVAAVELGRRARLLGGVLGEGDVAEPDQAPAALGHDQPGEVGRLVQAAAQPDGALGRAAR